MHEWHTNNSTNILQLIDEFSDFTFTTDYGGEEEVKEVRVTDRTFTTIEEARNYVTRTSYGSDVAFIATCTNGKTTKAFDTAFNNFKTRYKEYKDFESNLTISYGRKSDKVSCPNCHSSINLHYGGKFKVCPVCGSKKIISDSNWKMLETKYKLVQKASDNLSKEATKNKVEFICGIEWHC